MVMCCHRRSTVILLLAAFTLEHHNYSYFGKAFDFNLNHLHLILDMHEGSGNSWSSFTVDQIKPFRLQHVIPNWLNSGIISLQ